METIKSLDELIELLITIRPLVLLSENMEHLDDESAYDFGMDLGEKVGQEEYLPTLQEGMKLYHEGYISKLGADIKTLVYVCESTVEGTKPGLKFSAKSCETHLRAAARLAAYYAVIQLCFRRPGVTSEAIVAKLGQEFYDSLMGDIGRALSLKHAQKFIDIWGVLNWIETTATGIEEKLSNMD